MKPIFLIILIVSYLCILNVCLISVFDKKTMYKSGLHFEHTLFIFSYIFFGIFMFLFIKRIKEYRKKRYLEYKIRLCDYYLSSFPNIYSKGEEYMKAKRYLKLKKLK